MKEGENIRARWGDGGGEEIGRGREEMLRDWRGVEYVGKYQI